MSDHGDDRTSAADTGATPDHSLYDLYLQNGRRDLDKWHHYFSVYDRHFPPFRGRPISLLEIGVLGGGSLRLWRSYFGQDAAITGIDLDPACARHAGDGVEVFIGDQSDPAFLESVAAARGPFDIVIDDGGHTSRQQIISLETLTPHVKDGGLYVVEDTHTSLWTEYLDHPLGLSFLDVAARMAERLTWWHADRRSFDRYGVPPLRRPGRMNVPAVTRNFFSIAFYDSMVVFEKAVIDEPWREVR